MDWKVYRVQREVWTMFLFFILFFHVNPTYIFHT